MEAYIGGIEFGFGRDTNNKNISVNIYFSGCSKEPKCPGCHNPHLWIKENGTLMTLTYLEEYIRVQSTLAQALVFLGGEPLDQEAAVLELAVIADVHGMNTYLYTGKEIDEVSEIIKDTIDVIISGPYLREQANPVGIWPPSKNQVITRKE